MDSKAMTSLPVSWIKEKDYSVLALEQAFQSGEYQLSLDSDIELTLTSDDSVNHKEIYNSTVKTFFKTSFGVIALTNAEPLFEMITDFVYSQEYPLPIEKWYRVCMLNAPDNFSKLWGEMIPCDKQDIQEVFSINMNIVQKNSGVSSTIFASSETCRDILSSKLLNYVEKQDKFMDSGQGGYQMDLNLFQVTLSKENVESLGESDILLAENFLIDEEGFGSINLLDKDISIKLIKEDDKFYLEIIDINEHSVGHHLGVRYAGDFGKL